MNRSIDSGIWDDPWFVDLGDAYRAVWFYLCTHPNISKCGILQLNLAVAEVHTRRTKSEIKDALEAFQRGGKIEREGDNMVWVVKYAEYNCHNASWMQGALNDARKLTRKTEFLAQHCLQRYEGKVGRMAGETPAPPDGGTGAAGTGKYPDLGGDVLTTSKDVPDTSQDVLTTPSLLNDIKLNDISALEDKSGGAELALSPAAGNGKARPGSVYPQHLRVAEALVVEVEQLLALGRRTSSARRAVDLAHGVAKYEQQLERSAPSRAACCNLERELTSAIRELAAVPHWSAQFLNMAMWTTAAQWTRLHNDWLARVKAPPPQTRGVLPERDVVILDRVLALEPEAVDSGQLAVGSCAGEGAA